MLAFLFGFCWVASLLLLFLFFFGRNLFRKLEARRARRRQGPPRGSLDYRKRDAYDILTGHNLLGRSGATLTHRRRLNAHPFHHRHLLRLASVYISSIGRPDTPKCEPIRAQGCVFATRHHRVRLLGFVRGTRGAPRRVARRAGLGLGAAPLDSGAVIMSSKAPPKHASSHLVFGEHHYFYAKDARDPCGGSLDARRGNVPRCRSPSNARPTTSGSGSRRCSA